jgi:hypothetical protein
MTATETPTLPTVEELAQRAAESERIERTVQAKDVQRGDVLPDGHAVKAVKQGRVNVRFVCDDSVTVTFREDDTFVVLRSQPTGAARRAMTERFVAKRVDKATADFERLTAEMVGELAVNPRSALSWKAEPLAFATETFRCWSVLRKIAEQTGAWTEGAREADEWVAEQLNQAITRTTSLMDHALDIIDHDARLRFRSDLRMTGALSTSEG